WMSVASGMENLDLVGRPGLDEQGVMGSRATIRALTGDCSALPISTSTSVLEARQSFIQPPARV
ncbi:hypothetical protein, partial [Pseudomonas savastanoi]|uniref:hypothetical protein n=1 Tax=Pseudomonas savastanoi TaxID=29438 RepID=UPI001C81205F